MFCSGPRNYLGHYHCEFSRRVMIAFIVSSGGLKNVQKKGRNRQLGQLELDDLRVEVTYLEGNNFARAKSSIHVAIYETQNERPLSKA